VSSRARVSRPTPLDQRPDHLGEEASDDAVGPLAGDRDGDVAGWILTAELGGPDPGGDGPPAAGEDGPEEQEGEPRSGGRGQLRATRTTGKGRVAGEKICHRGPAPVEASGSVVTAIVPAGPASVYRLHGWRGGREAVGSLI
jgi:hypothetical protein